MAFSASILPEFDYEMANTRKMLERVPEDKFAWKPHAKSFSMIELASHLAYIPGWTGEMFSTDSMDVMPGGEPIIQPPAGSSTELLALFDKNSAQARAALAEADDARFLAPWSFLVNGKIIMTQPRIAFLRGFILSHAIHHRAQLGMYLRLTDVPVPSMYGPTADESGM